MEYGPQKDGRRIAGDDCRAASCPNPEKADAIFRMIVLGLYLPDGRETPRYLSRPEIMKMMELGRKAGNIAMRYMEILRFEELENGSSPWKSRSGSGCTDTEAPHLPSQGFRWRTG